jgi:predicted DNA-binding protein
MNAMRNQKSFTIRMSEWHLETLKTYAESQDKTMTQAIKDLIEKLPDTQSSPTNS